MGEQGGDYNADVGKPLEDEVAVARVAEIDEELRNGQSLADELSSKLNSKVAPRLSPEETARCTVQLNELLSHRMRIFVEREKLMRGFSHIQSLFSPKK